jgi:hypothetical protein
MRHVNIDRSRRLATALATKQSSIDGSALSPKSAVSGGSPAAFFNTKKCELQSLVLLTIMVY